MIPALAASCVCSISSKKRTPFDAYDMDETLVRALFTAIGCRPRRRFLRPPQSAWTFHRRPRSFALSTVKATDFGAGMHQRRQVRAIYRASFL
ncbi:MAG: hypothetical protein WAK55_11290 [Xanthobacteraceae bacterium]